MPTSGHNVSAFVVSKIVCAVCSCKAYSQALSRKHKKGSKFPSLHGTIIICTCIIVLSIIFSRAENTFVPPDIINPRLKVVGTDPDKVMSTTEIMYVHVVAQWEEGRTFPTTV